MVSLHPNQTSLAAKSLETGNKLAGEHINSNYIHFKSEV